MRKYSVILAIVMLMGLVFYGLSANAQNEPGTMGRGYGYGQGQGGSGWNYCPWCGNYLGPDSGYLMGPGMMGRGYNYNYGMGPGMMGPGYGYGRGGGPGMMGPGYGSGRGSQYAPEYLRPQKPLDKDEAQQEVQNYLKSIRNPNLKIGDIQEKDDAYEVNVVTKDGSLVDKIMVDKNTGQMSSGY